MKKLELKAYGKINLTLDILGKRPDGYHEIATVLQQISLHDKVSVKWIPGGHEGVVIEIGTNKRYLPTDERNIAYKAADLLVSRYPVADKFGPGTVRIDIKKQIPVAAGLGGGSANGAAALIGLSEIWELGLGEEELLALGAKLGSDVPFCVMGQKGKTCALAKGTGTELTPQKGVSVFIVLSKPPVSVSTAAAYKGFALMEEKSFERPNISDLIFAMKQNDLEEAGKNMINVLENYTLAAYPGVRETKGLMLKSANPVKVLMSGSGPTIIGFYKDRKSAEEAYKTMAAINKDTYLTRTMT